MRDRQDLFGLLVDVRYALRTSADAWRRRAPLIPGMHIPSCESISEHGVSLVALSFHRAICLVGS